MKYDPKIHHRRSIRLKGYDYSQPGAYFVTTCLDGYDPYFEIQEIRSIMEDTWKSLPERFPTISLDEFVIMPDHIHFIVWLSPTKNDRPPLDRIVGAYKSLTARAALKHLRQSAISCGKVFWQRDYYEHVVRNEAELREIRTYILNNPIKAELIRTYYQE
jgi:REP element-mobilizing transposase RayT